MDRLIRPGPDLCVGSPISLIADIAHRGQHCAMDRLTKTALLAACLGLVGGCDTLFHVGLSMAGLESPDKQIYDDSVCRYGPPSGPAPPNRPGCVNSKSVTENGSDFDRYKNERQLLLEKGK